MPSGRGVRISHPRDVVLKNREFRSRTPVLEGLAGLGTFCTTYLLSSMKLSKHFWVLFPRLLINTFPFLLYYVI